MFKIKQIKSIIIINKINTKILLNENLMIDSFGSAQCNLNMNQAFELQFINKKQNICQSDTTIQFK